MRLRHSATVNGERHPCLAPSALTLVLVGVENVQLMQHDSCAGTLRMAQIPRKKSEQKHKEDVCW